MDIIDLIEHIKNFPPSPNRLAMWHTRRLGEIAYLLIHHTAGSLQDADGNAIPDAEEATPLEVHESQRNRNFGLPAQPAFAPRITYHYLVSPPGVAYKVNKAEWVTWHCPGRNRDGLSICIIGNREVIPIQATQYDSLLILARTVMAAYSIPVERVAFHRTYFATACPGRLLNLDDFRRDLESISV